MGMQKCVHLCQDKPAYKKLKVVVDILLDF